jgi:hypothetical protein
VRQAIQALPNPVAMGDKLPVLRVIAAWPSPANLIGDNTKDKHPLATLRMDKVTQLVDLRILTVLGRQVEQEDSDRILDDPEVRAEEAATDVESSDRDADSPDADSPELSDDEEPAVKRARHN